MWRDVVPRLADAWFNYYVGPMVYAAAYWAKSKNDEISKMGFNGDSFPLPSFFRFKTIVRCPANASFGVDRCEGLDRLCHSHTLS